MKLAPYILILSGCLALSCNKDESGYQEIKDPYASIKAAFGTNINPDALSNYASQDIPAYINLDNSGNNPVTDKGATLGRVLFYDKNLSATNTVSCATCHAQANAFSDTNIASIGVNGTTTRHSMRLVNARFSVESKFFWDERAVTLEQQTTTPVKDHAEMGYSGLNGAPSINELITRLKGIGYYNELFNFVYGTEEITEEKIQSSLAQFVRSIQSFDSKYDTGRALAGNDGAPFTNYTPQENQGKNLFLTPPVFNANGRRIDGGVGCAGCHKPPQFDIDPNSLNNGVIGILGAMGEDLTNTRAPSLRDVAKPDGTPNSPYMHTGEFTTLAAVVAHYNSIMVTNANLDVRLNPAGSGQQLNLTANEIAALVAFLNTLSGTNLYVDSKWSDPFVR